MRSLLDAALVYAEAGLAVFPCQVDGKKPACPNGYKDATVDPVRIRELWRDQNYNIGFCPAIVGWSVIDLDPGGEASWIQLITDRAVPPTYEVTTPRGGKHLYFSGVIPSTAQKLGSHIDTRGSGGYVLLPPSTVAGKSYVVSSDREIAPLPDFISQSLERVEVDKTALPAGSLDNPQNLSRARAYLDNLVARGDVAREGQGGNNRTYQVLCAVIDLGISESACLSLITDWNKACEPPWDTPELADLVRHAYQYRQNPAGVLATESSKLFADSPVVKAALAQTPVRSKFYPENEEEQDQSPDPVWLLTDVIQDPSTVLLIGPTQSYKSFLALDMALGIATGSMTFGSQPTSGPVFYAALEGRANLKRSRRRAWKVAREINAPIRDFYVMLAPQIGLPGEVQEFGDQITKRLNGRNPKLIVLDTVSKMMAGLDENNALEANKFIRFCDSLVENFRCSVIAVHHTGKDDKRGARGSSAFQAGFDTVLSCHADRDTKTVSVKVVKHKDAEERAMPFRFEGRVVGNSLVFFPTETGPPDDGSLAKKIGALLKTWGCYENVRTVSTDVLASGLLTPEELATPESKELAFKTTYKKLQWLSSQCLRAYHKNGMWSLPANEAHS